MSLVLSNSYAAGTDLDSVYYSNFNETSQAGKATVEPQGERVRRGDEEKATGQVTGESDQYPSRFLFNSNCLLQYPMSIA